MNAKMFDTIRSGIDATLSQLQDNTASAIRADITDVSEEIDRCMAERDDQLSFHKHLLNETIHHLMMNGDTLIKHIEAGFDSRIDGLKERRSFLMKKLEKVQPFSTVDSDDVETSEPGRVVHTGEDAERPRVLHRDGVTLTPHGAVFNKPEATNA